MTQPRVNRHTIAFGAGFILLFVISTSMVAKRFYDDSVKYRECIQALRNGFSSVSLGATREEVIAAMKVEPSIVSKNVQDPLISEAWIFSCDVYGTHFAVDFDNSGLVVNKEEFDFP